MSANVLVLGSGLHLTVTLTNRECGRHSEDVAHPITKQEEGMRELPRQVGNME